MLSRQASGSGRRIRRGSSTSRQIPFARWNGDDKVWEVPYASYDDLQHRWEAIEEGAKRAEPEERRKRAEARKGSEEEAKAKRRTSERRKRRLPVPSDDLPPLERPVPTAAYGIVVFELVDPEEVAEHHPDADDEHVWGGWRAASLEELVHTWPARTEPGEYERFRAWWQPTLEELREARTAAKSRERRRGRSETPKNDVLDIDRLLYYMLLIGIADERWK